MKQHTVYHCRESAKYSSGQAMFELLMLLFALMFLVVALVVLSAVCGMNNAHLLSNKYAAEMAAQSESADVIYAGEIGGWSRYSVKLYRNSEKINIPFTHRDQRYGFSGSTGGLDYRLQNSADSAAEGYNYRYLDIMDFQQREGRIQEAAAGDAMTAARMVRRNSTESSGHRSSDVRTATALRNVMGDVFRRLFGRLPDAVSNITNQVYMPLQQH